MVENSTVSVACYITIGVYTDLYNTIHSLEWRGRSTSRRYPFSELIGGIVLVAKETTAHFTVDVKASLFTVQAFASGIVAVIAHSPKFAVRDIHSDVLLDMEDIERSTVYLSIRLSGLDILDEVTNADRRQIERVMSDEVLESKLYPIAEFRSSRIASTKAGENMYRVTLTGDLALHGITRSIALESQLVAGEDTLRIQGSFSLLQSDYGLRIASVANGTLKLKDQLKFGFFLVARRKR
jgi:polyisoprenoid-binding protein YceI